MKIVAVCACTVGIAHTYMAKKAIEEECKKRGFEYKVEAQGGLGIENELTQEDVDSADIVINAIDVGIAVGSACSVAANSRADTRVMFSAGMAAQRLDLLEGCRQVIAIPVSISSKNPFFDRKPQETR